MFVKKLAGNLRLNNTLLDFRREARQNLASVGQFVGCPPTAFLYNLAS
jgi:hypothetical protein